jgi:AcrR family transcriptional regulator
VAPEGLTPSAYFVAALELLAEEGHDGLTIAALCQQLGVTKGSFYHHFRDFSSFVDALLAHWATEHASSLIALSEALTDTEERFELLLGIAIGLPHGAEAAIRAWSWSSPRVADELRRVDQARLAHLTEAVTQAGCEPERALLMARISLSTLIGLQQLERPARRETFDEVFSQLRRWALESAREGEPAGTPIAF